MRPRSTYAGVDLQGRAKSQITVPLPALCIIRDVSTAVDYMVSLDMEHPPFDH